MAVDQFPEIKEGLLRENEGIVVMMVAAGAIDLWAPVILAAVGTGEKIPRVNTTTTGGHEEVFGVTVGPKLDSGKAADAAGDKVQVCVFGMCKCKVDHTVAIAISDSLQTFTTAGQAQKLVPFDVPATVNEVNLQAEWDLKAGKAFAKALKASATNGDIISVFVFGPAGGAIR